MSGLISRRCEHEVIARVKSDGVDGAVMPVVLQYDSTGFYAPYLSRVVCNALQPVDQKHDVQT